MMLLSVLKNEKEVSFNHHFQNNETSCTIYVTLLSLSSAFFLCRKSGRFGQNSSEDEICEISMWPHVAINCWSRCNVLSAAVAFVFVENCCVCGSMTLQIGYLSDDMVLSCCSQCLSVCRNS